MDELSFFLKRKGAIKQGIRPINKSWIINIEITNSCKMGCTNCTRATKHMCNPFFSSLEHIERSLNSLKDWPRGIGLIGGEPQDHPQWDAICRLLRKFRHRGGYALFTSRDLSPEYKDIFRNGKIYITDHKIQNLHHPLLITLEEVVPDPSIHRELIEKCWLQRLWSPSISPKGGFWCEIAGVIDLMWNGPGGYSIEPGWWQRDSYEEQIEQSCKKCGVCIPVKIETDHEQRELVTPKVFERLKEMGSPYLNKCQLYTETLSNDVIRARQKKMANLCFIQERTRMSRNPGIFF